MKALNMCLRLAHLVRCSLSLGIPEINPGCVCWIGGVSPFLLAIKKRKIWRHHKVYVVFYIFYLLFSLDVHRLCLAFSFILPLYYFFLFRLDVMTSQLWSFYFILPFIVLYFYTLLCPLFCILYLCQLLIIYVFLHFFRFFLHSIPYL